MNIAVVGNGVIGLTSAARLREAGHNVTIFARGGIETTTSSRSGSVFTPFDGAQNSAWVVESLRTYRDLAQHTPESGIRISTARELFSTPLAALPAWTSIVGGANRLGPVGHYAGGYEVRVPHIDTAVFLPWLLDRVTRVLGVPVIHRTLTSLNQLLAHDVDRGPGAARTSFDGVINCSGVGARELAGDPAVRAMRGQLLHVPNTLGLVDSIGASEPDGAMTYVYPYPSRIVMGGTYEPDVWDERTEPVAIEAILARGRELLRVTGVKGWETIGETRIRTVAGLRPARIVGGLNEAVRLERAATDAGKWIIHNYGHGRAGMTLSWGCATEVVSLVNRS